jgi:hypothetical protein
MDWRLRDPFCRFEQSVKGRARKERRSCSGFSQIKSRCASWLPYSEGLKWGPLEQRRTKAGQPRRTHQEKALRNVEFCRQKSRDQVRLEKIMRPLHWIIAISVFWSSVVFADGNEHWTLRYEVQGRISGLWNHAKYVRISERDGENAPWRTTSEFIEITQPQRAYPKSSQPTGAPSPVAACEFLTRVIPVDGNIRRDIPGEGWVIPLWDRLHPDAGPQIRVLSRDGTWTNMQQKGALSFFTSTRLKTPPDEWPPVRDVDFPAEETLP